ncbi:tetratricopeptide repeat-containing glycosyltransferase family 2 protein [Paenibacillus sp. FJAT-27812]|uniref:tetratricopeptide repeat-containing glycosyltransferase family 2 protein n=1 Tax=Paenibacillus sp. FJAT-27812 TaxID=1684143 RepID=UPI0006A7B156|nr:glycosyltransferase family 2 protein [Paenibacillus sp. FJAT-27812]
MNAEDKDAVSANTQTMARKPPVSLCMIVRDEETLLPACLASAQAYVSEIIIVDTGSTDRTVQIAEGFGAKVVRAVWTDDFAAARNLGLEQAKQPWVLVLDADERIEPAALDIWEDLLANTACAGYYIKLCSWIGSSIEGGNVLEAGDAFIADAVCRLFRNDPQIRFRGALHEEAATSITSFGERALAYAPVTVWHEGYRAEVVARKGKRERNRRILQAALHHNPEDPVLHYAMGTECFTYRNWAEAAAWLEPVAQQLKANDGYASDLLLKLSYACLALGRLHAAEKWARKGIVELGFADFPDLYEALALALQEQDRNAESLAVLEQALHIGSVPDYYSTAPGAGSYRTLHAAGIVCERLYAWEKAADCYSRSAARQPRYLAAWERLMLLGTVDDRFRLRLLEALSKLLDEGSEQEIKAVGEALLERMGDAGFETLARNEDGSQAEGKLGYVKNSEVPIVEKLIASVFGADHKQQALFWRGLLCVQLGDCEQGRELWEQLPEADERRALYLYALALREAGGGIVPARECSAPLEQALLRVRAWQAWVDLAGAGGISALPPLQWCAVIRAPQGARAPQRYALASGSSAPAQLAAGVLAAAAADWRAAAGSFGSAATSAAAQPWVARAAAAGLAAAFAARARAAVAAAIAMPPLQVEAETRLRAVSALFS